MALSAPASGDRPVIAVRTTGIFCRDGCPAPAPHPQNAVRLPSAGVALFSGYRPCLRCRPLDAPAVALTDAELRRATLLRPVLRAAGRARRSRSGTHAIITTLIDTPLGPMLAGATDDGICLAEFADRRMLPTQLDTLRRRLDRPIVAGSHPHLDRLRKQLTEYFAGERRAFDVPVIAPGSAFQERTWAELRQLAPGTTVSYEELAQRVGRPHAQRAVGTANGANRIAVVIPCHRVVRKSGETGNYGGGRWRKEWLLAHEAALAATAP
jgi:O-6-methylguanine DNA methyltransferase